MSHKKWCKQNKNWKQWSVTVNDIAKYWRVIQRDYWEREKEWVKDGILILIEWYPASRAKAQFFFIIAVKKIVPVY